MPNYIQYSTSIPSGSLKKGNAALGITDSVAGPTSNTGWYTGINPPTGSYTVYEVAASGDPDIYCPQNTTELLNLVKSKGATGGDTGSVAAALAWIATQNNLLATNEVYPNIVTSGLSTILDAGFVGSYPTTASTWYDVSGFGKNGTLNNAPTFNNAGYITFDGIDDSATFTANTFNSDSPQQGTFSALIKFPTLSTSSQTVLFGDGGTFGFSGINLYRNINFPTNAYGWLIYSTGSTGQGFYLQNVTYLPGRWYDTTFTFVNTGTGSSYRNGELINSSAAVGGGNFISWRRSGNNQPFITPSSPAGTGSIQSFKYYNRALTQAEILQNYYQAPIVTDGLVFAVDASNLVSYESGSTTTYSLTGSFTGSLQNGVSFLPDNGGVFNFDGVDDIIRFGNINPSEITIEIWKKWTTISDDWLITNTTTTVTDTTKGYYMRIDSLSTTFTVYFGIGSTSRGVTYTPTLLNKWTYVVATYDPVIEGAKLYWDGVLVGTNTGTGSIDYAGVQGLTIGAANDLSRGTPGPVGPVRIYNRALSSSEVSQNFNAQRNRFNI